MAVAIAGARLHHTLKQIRHQVLLTLVLLDYELDREN